MRKIIVGGKHFNFKIVIVVCAFIVISCFKCNCVLFCCFACWYFMKMGQQKSEEQCDIFVKFMAKHPDLAKGFSKDDRVKQDELWLELANQLNASGLPNRDVAVWKKNWCDWRRSVKRRLAENKCFSEKAGRRSFLTPNEEQIAIICDFYHSVDGVPNAKTFGPKQRNAGKRLHAEQEDTSLQEPWQNRYAEQEDTSLQAPVQQTPSSFDQRKRKAAKRLHAEEVDTSLQESLQTIFAEQENTSFQAPAQQTPPITPTVSPAPAKLPPKCVRKTFSGDLQEVIVAEDNNFQRLEKKIDLLREEMKTSNNQFKELNKNMRKIRSIKRKSFESKQQHYKNLEKLKEKSFEAKQRHYYQLEKQNASRIRVKIEILKLQQIKYQVSSRVNCRTWQR